MRRVCFLFAALALVGCSRGQAGSSEFDQRFEQAKKENGLSQAVVIEAPSGQQLQTNVQRVGEPFPPEGAKLTKKLPDTLSPRLLARILRRRVSRLKYCLLEGTARRKTGKVILTLTISSSGRVSSVKVDAPAFKNTGLAECIRQTAQLWRFPSFKRGSVTHSYPIIFRGR